MMWTKNRVPSVLAVFCLMLLAAVAVAHASGSGEKSGPGPEIKHYNQGVALLKKGDYAAARAELEAALEAKEAFPEAHNNLAYALRKLGEAHYEEALSHYDRALELAPDLAEAHMYRGVLHVLMGDSAAAEQDLEALRGHNDKLADELAWVIENGAEKEGSQAGIAGVW